MTADVLASDKMKARKYDLGKDWSAFPEYDKAAMGLREYWYPVLWARELKKKPKGVRLCGENLVLHRGKDGRPRALHDRCPHRGVKLSLGKEWWPGTVSCPYHGWTFDVDTGDLVAVITDGPDSTICGKAAVKTYPAQERLGLIWVYMGDEKPHSLRKQLPFELADPPTKYATGGRIQDRSGNWRFYVENGFDEGHAKYLHRTSIYRIMGVMPTWNEIHIEKHGNWIYRIEDKRHWDAVFPGLGTWTNERWWKRKPKQRQGKFMGNVGGGKTDPNIAKFDFPGFASTGLPGVARIVYPQFYHYEFYVPIDEDHTKYVGFMIQYRTGLSKLWYYFKYLTWIRWAFHGDFSSQDHWMVGETTAPPERLYRPDVSLIEWRKLFDGTNPFKKKKVSDENQSEPEKA